MMVLMLLLLVKDEKTEKRSSLRLKINAFGISMNEKLIEVNYLNFMILNDLNEKYDLFDLEVLCEELIIDED
jgi:hypothetical protein